MRRWIGLLLSQAFFAFMTFGMTKFGPSMTAQGLSWVGAAMIISLALPAIFGWWQWQRATSLKSIVALGLFAWLFESLAVATGWPYGHFHYVEAFGSKIFNLVPWTVPFAWMPIALGCWSLAQQRWPKAWRYRILATAICLVLYDLVLDPGAVALGYWIWHEPGWYYGIPWSNYFGWFLSGLGGAGLIEVLIRHQQTASVPRSITLSLFLSLSLWTWVAGWLGLTFPFIFGLILIGALFYSEYRPTAKTSKHSQSSY